MNGRPWTERHAEILRRMAGKYTDEEIAATTGHRRETVTRRRLALGLDPCRQVDWLARLMQQGGIVLTS